MKYKTPQYVKNQTNSDGCGSQGECYEKAILKLEEAKEKLDLQRKELELSFTNQQNILENKLIPVGTVVAFSGTKTSIPSGWMACEGQPLDSKKYPVLYQTITTIYGKGDRSLNTDFNLPDYRGYFLRGVDETGRKDPDYTKRTDLSGKNNIGAQVGSYQEDIVGAHRHYIAIGGGENKEGLPGVYVERINYPSISAFTSSGNSAKDSESGTIGNETRPDNVYVYWIIRTGNPTN